ncbi:hypothetical protein [Kitasatospora fiedleri]|uniref:hypothetical protein n=1 Tax=Kitasatospora fiedleri TaxID=2991545 RepID=UPI00249C37C5|nr:hypothetical protein [Kitasatospora fiedleri]
MFVAAALAAHAVTGALPHPGVGVEEVLQLGGVHVAADDGDHVLDPVDDGEAAVPVEAADL